MSTHRATLSDDYWKLLVGAVQGRDPIVTCDQVGEQNDCGTAFAPDYEDEAYLYVSDRGDRWRVEYASSSVD